ncbi:MAG: hypothetical protein L6Q76_34770, partial [Polyangiaceae bacterium]|nr:hypothetical protein [Polyangiaceae bacterium]
NARSPDDPRVKDLHKEAGERLVTDALGRKYEGDVEGAQKLAKLALEIAPALTTAQHLLAELTHAASAPPPPEAPPESVASDAAGKKNPAPAPAPAPTPKDIRFPAPKTQVGGPVLPPTPPPLPPTGTAPPAPTGPWL